MNMWIYEVVSETTHLLGSGSHNLGTSLKKTQ